MSENWEGGERQGVRWRRLGAGVLVVAVGAATFYAVRNRNQLGIETGEGPAVEVSETVEVVVTAPLRAGDRWYCPTTYPVAAFDDGEYRPAEYPRVDQSERPAQCYADPQRAEDDGYDLADPPDGVVLAGGIYLEPVRLPHREGCANAATWVGVTVPCPTRLPTPADGPSCEIDSCVFGDRSGVIIEHRQFRVPRDWPPDVEPHVVLTAVGVARERGDGSLQVSGPQAFGACRAGDPVAAPQRPQFIQCPEGNTWIPRFQGDPHEGHTAAFWRRNDVVYGASVEGTGGAAEELLHALIDGIEYVDPRDPDDIEGP